MSQAYCCHSFLDDHVRYVVVMLVCFVQSCQVHHAGDERLCTAILPNPGEIFCMSSYRVIPLSTDSPWILDAAKVLQCQTDLALTYHTFGAWPSHSIKLLWYGNRLALKCSFRTHIRMGCLISRTWFVCRFVLYIRIHVEMKTMTKSRLDSRLELVSKQSVFVGSSLMRCWRRPVAWQQKQWEIFDWQYMSICNMRSSDSVPIPP